MNTLIYPDSVFVFYTLTIKYMGTNKYAMTGDGGEIIIEKRTIE